MIFNLFLLLTCVYIMVTETHTYASLYTHIHICKAFTFFFVCVRDAHLRPQVNFAYSFTFIFKFLKWDISLHKEIFL